MALLRNTVPAKVSMQRNFVLNSNVILIALQSSSLDDYLTSSIEFLYLSLFFRYSASLPIKIVYDNILYSKYP